jgi:type II secretory pathway component GspD/PulD (secretin)
LFGRQTLNLDKTELLVLVRPVVVASIEQARDASEEIRGKMLRIGEAFGTGVTPKSSVETQGIPAAAEGVRSDVSTLRFSPVLGSQLPK